MNYTDMLRKAIELAGPAIEAGDEATLEQLDGELASLTSEIEAMFKEWDDPPPGIEEMVDEMDESYYQAGEAFLQVCDLIRTGIADKETEPLEEALQGLDEAVEAMRQAEEVVRSKLLTEGSK